MKKILLLAGIAYATTLQAQKIDSIYVNLYTDSLKKGTYNYINVDGLLANGRYWPLDSTHLEFSASVGSFFGNSLWVPVEFAGEKISITVTLRQNPVLKKQFDMFIKRLPDGPLKTVDEIMGEMKPKKKS